MAWDICLGKSTIRSTAPRAQSLAEYPASRACHRDAPKTYQAVRPIPHMPYQTRRASFPTNHVFQPIPKPVFVCLAFQGFRDSSPAPLVASFQVSITEATRRSLSVLLKGKIETATFTCGGLPQNKNLSRGRDLNLAPTVFVSLYEDKEGDTH